MTNKIMWWDHVATTLYNITLEYSSLEIVGKRFIDKEVLLIVKILDLELRQLI